MAFCNPCFFSVLEFFSLEPDFVNKECIQRSSGDLQKPAEQDGKACAAVGQPDLIALFKTLFSKDVTQAQCLVTDNDFRGKVFKRQLKETVEHLLTLNTIPIFNENDAVSTRRDPYEDSSGIFWDNDSLAALLAKELKADLLILLSDVEGLYNGPPSDTNSELIHTYIKERHQGEIIFGEKSRVGTRGHGSESKCCCRRSFCWHPCCYHQWIRFSKHYQSPSRRTCWYSFSSS